MAATGRWRQVLNESATYLETSSTAMVLTSLATGVRKGWLTPAASFVQLLIACLRSGVGFAPCRPDDREKLIGLLEGVEDIPGTALHEGMEWAWETFPE
mgnify:CR=1 FL=1